MSQNIIAPMTALVIFLALAGYAHAEEPHKEPPLPSTPGSDSADKDRALTILDAFINNEINEQKFTEHEAERGKCKLDKDTKTATLTFRADGVLHCRIREVPDDWRFQLYILVPKTYSSPDRYVVTPIPGSYSDSILRSGPEAARPAAAVVAATDDMSPVWLERKGYGPFETSDVTFKIDFKIAGNSQSSKINLTHYYPLNIGVAFLLGPGQTTYSVSDKKIQADSTKVEPNYYINLQTYPLAWHRADGSIKYGRVFNKDFSPVYEWFSLCVGFNVAHPTDALFLGVGFEPFVGLSLVGGWQPRRVQQLIAPYQIGTTIADSSVPLNHQWDLKNYGVGVSFDVSIAKTILGAVK